MKDWIEIISALGQICIAASVAYIAWRSYALSKAGFYVKKDELRLALFDRRFKVYEGFRDLLMDFVIHMNINDGKLSKFIQTTADTEFLFGKEVSEYRKEIIEKCIRQRQLQLKFERDLLNDEERCRFAEEMEGIEKWLPAQKDHINVVFRKYLHFTIDAHPK